MIKDRDNLKYLEQKYNIDPNLFDACINVFSTFVSFEDFEMKTTSKELFQAEIEKIPLAKEITKLLLKSLKDHSFTTSQIAEIEKLISRYLLYSFLKKITRRMILPLFRPLMFLKNRMNGRGPISQILKYFSNDMDQWILKLQRKLTEMLHDPFFDDLITSKPGTKNSLLEDELLHGFKSIICSKSKYYMPTLQRVVPILKNNYPLIFDDVPIEDPNTLRQAIRRSERCTNFHLFSQGT